MSVASRHGELSDEPDCRRPYVQYPAQDGVVARESCQWTGIDRLTLEILDSLRRVAERLAEQQPLLLGEDGQTGLSVLGSRAEERGDPIDEIIVVVVDE